MILNPNITHYPGTAEVVAANVVVAVVMAKVEVVLDVLGCSPQNWHLNFFPLQQKSWKLSGTLFW